MANKQDILKLLEMKSTKVYREADERFGLFNKSDELEKFETQRNLKGKTFKIDGVLYEIYNNYSNFHCIDPKYLKLKKESSEHYDKKEQWKKEKLNEISGIKEKVLLYGVDKELAKLIENI